MLNNKSLVPLYQQIIDKIKARIESGEYNPGQLLPSEAMFCSEFGVSRVTVRSALSVLIDEGIIVTKHGKGTFVKEHIKQQKSNHFRGFTDFCKENNRSLYTHVLLLEQQPATSKLISILSLQPGEPVVYLRRVRFIDYKPILIEETWLPFGKYAFLLNKDMENRSLYKTIMDETGFDPASNGSNTIELETSIATKEEAEQLNIDEGNPLFVLKETVLDNNEIPVHLTKQLMVGSNVKFMMNEDSNGLKLTID